MYYCQSCSTSQPYLFEFLRLLNSIIRFAIDFPKMHIGTSLLKICITATAVIAALNEPCYGAGGTPGKF